jgi:hypothetical protein
MPRSLSSHLRRTNQSCSAHATHSTHTFLTKQKYFQTSFSALLRRERAHLCDVSLRDSGQVGQHERPHTVPVSRLELPQRAAVAARLQVVSSLHDVRVRAAAAFC